MTIVTKDIDLAVTYLKAGKVVALPTETVYGLAASIYQKGALDEIYRLKNRPNDNPLIVHVLDLKSVDLIAHVTGDFLKIYEAFMPGPISVLLEKKAVSDVVTAGLDTVAIRVPSHPVFRAVIEKLGEPIAAPSANLSGKPSSTDASHVFFDFNPSLSLILDGGECLFGIESTIVQIFDDYGVILRPGGITKESLEKLLQKPFIYAAKNAKLQAPGMKYKHYAPSAEVVLIYEKSDLDLQDASAMIMAYDVIDCLNYEKLSAKNLYRSFRKADEMGLSKIYVLMDEIIDEGLKNRLEKASN